MEIVTQTAGAVTGFLHNPLRNTQLNDGDFKRESAPIERGNSPSLAPPAEPPKPATPRGPRNLKLRAALRLAKLHNLAIFPAKPNEKTPAFVGWQGAATSNAEAITKWWTENPDFNIGVSTQGLLVLDV